MRPSHWIFAAVLAAPAAALADGARALDGANFELGGERLRLFGVSAPGLGQRCEEWREHKPLAYACGEHARALLQSLVQDRAPACVREPSAPGAATCYVDGRDLGLVLVSAGWAVARRDESNRYLRAQDEARTASRGLWSGRFDDPNIPASKRAH